MKETPTTQYLFAPAELMFHLAENGSHAICGFYAGESGPKRRRDDWRLTSEKPQRVSGLDALCPKCQRAVDGEVEPEIDWLELRAHHFMDTPPPS
jgi:hypothetical protein